ncbi:hypothetical protein ES703_72512 [subsurface metagenome]
MSEEAVAIAHNLQDAATEEVALLLGMCLEQAHYDVLLLEVSITGDTHLLGQLNQLVSGLVF